MIIRVILRKLVYFLVCEREFIYGERKNERTIKNWRYNIKEEYFLITILKFLIFY